MKDTPGILPRILRRYGTKTLVVATAVAMVLAAIAVLSLVSFDITRYAPRVESMIESSSGGRAKVGKMSLKLLPSPAVTLGRVSVSKDGVASAVLRSVRIRISPFRLLSGQIAATSVEADGAEISVSKDLLLKRDGKAGFSLPVRSVTLRRAKVKAPGAWAGLPDTVNLSSAYLKAGGEGFVYGVEGTFEQGPAFGISGGFSPDLKGVSGAGSVKGFDTNLIYARLKEICGCVPVTGVIEARFSFNYASPRIDLNVERFSLAASGFSLKGSSAFSGSPGAGGTFKVGVSSTPIPLQTLKAALPRALMPDGVAAVIKAFDPEEGGKPPEGGLPPSGSITVKDISISGAIGGMAPNGGYTPKGGYTSFRPDGISVDARLDNLRFRYSGLSNTVSELSGAVTLKEDVLTLRGATARYGNGHVKTFNARVRDLKGRMDYDASLDMLIDAGESLEAARRLAGGAVVRRIEKITASGGVDLTLAIKGSIYGGKETRYSGTARLTDIKFGYAGAPVSIKSLNGEAVFDNKRISVKKLSGGDGHSVFELDGFVEDYTAERPSFEFSAAGRVAQETFSTFSKALSSGGLGIDGELEFNTRVKSREETFAVYASFDTVKPKGGKPPEAVKPPEGGETPGVAQAAASPRLLALRGGELLLEETYAPPGGIAPLGAMGGTGSVRVKEGNLWGHPFEGFSASLTLDAEAVVFNPVGMKFDGGNAQGYAAFYRKKEAPLSFDARFDFAGLDLETLISAAGAKKRALGGDLNASVAMSGRRGAQPFSSGLNGRITVASERGRLYKFLILTKIFSIVNIISIDELFKDGLPYKRLTGDFALKDGIITTENLYLDSDSMRMSAAGEIDLPRSGINAYLALHPFVTIDKVVSSIPVAGWIIAGKEKSFINMYYGITGPLKKPDVSPAPVKNISTGIVGILERLVETPAGPDIPAQAR